MSVRIWRHFDPWIMTIAVVLVLLGIAFVNSASLDVASLAELVPRQMVYGAAGVVVALVFAAIDYRNLLAVHWYIYGFVVLLLGVIFVTGEFGDAGARRWLLEGAVQPSELAKVLLIVTLAQYLAGRQDQMHKLSTVLRSLVYMAIPAGFLFLQPDLGMAVVLMVIWFAMIWLAGLNWRHLGLFALIGGVLSPIVWSLMQVYQKQRIIAFISPSLVPDQEYNMRQALISIGSGGLLGKGYGGGSQSQLHFLRVRHTDFIFSVIAEEVGLVGALVVLMLFGLLIFRILKVARMARDSGGMFLCYGIAALIFFQTTVSIGMNLQLLPVTGLTLPFISYGGSSLITLLLSVGLVESVLMRSMELEHRR